RHRNIEVMTVRFAPAVLLLGLALGVSAAACGPRAEERDDTKPPVTVPPAIERTPTAIRPRIVVLGDSLTAGLGLAARDSYPMLLRQRLDADRLYEEVVKAGLAGDTW